MILCAEKCFQDSSRFVYLNVRTNLETSELFCEPIMSVSHINRTEEEIKSEGISSECVSVSIFPVNQTDT